MSTCTRPACAVIFVSLGMYVSVTSSVSGCLPATQGSVSTAGMQHRAGSSPAKHGRTLRDVQHVVGGEGRAAPRIVARGHRHGDEAVDLARGRHGAHERGVVLGQPAQQLAADAGLRGRGGASGGFQNHRCNQGLLETA